MRREEAGQTVAGSRIHAGNGRKVRTPQDRVTVNGRPSKTARHKTRNRATETSVLGYGETRQPPPGAIPNRHALMWSAERVGRKLEPMSNLGSR